MPIKRKPTCWCTAYKFPHRCGSGKCKRRKPIVKTKRTYARMQKANAKWKRTW